MLSVLIGAISNIILDPVFIFGFHMGVRGAALATVISQHFLHLGPLIPLWKKTFLKLRKSTMKLKADIILPVWLLALLSLSCSSVKALSLSATTPPS